jgi:hypothetical protein
MFTPFTSAAYARGDLAASTIIGEDPAAVRNWDAGNPPDFLPDRLTSGNVADLQRGCAGDGTPPAGYFDVNGIDARCFTTIPQYTLGNWNDLDPENPAVLLLLAQLLEWSYTDPAAAAAFFLFWLGPGVTVTVTPNTDSLYPGSIIVAHPRWTIVAISGTSNPQQLALQGLFSVAGPVNMGPYSTIPLWQLAALQIAGRMTAAGVNPNNPVLVTGHSYGGAVASLLTEILRRGNTARPLRLVTFGSPAPGDDRLQRGLRGIPQWHFSTLDDPVPQTPLTGPSLYGLQAILPVGLRAAWSRWQAPSVYRLIDTDPGLPAVQFGNLAWAVLRDLALAAAAGRPVNPFPQHSIAYYLALLRALNPGVNPWPIPGPVKDELKSSSNWTLVDRAQLVIWGE